MSWYKGVAKAFKEVRFILPGSGTARAEGARTFLSQHYGNMLSQNPRPHVVVRECEGVDSYVIFRYEYGVEKKVPLDDLTPQQLEETFQKQMASAERVNRSL